MQHSAPLGPVTQSGLLQRAGSLAELSHMLATEVAAVASNPKRKAKRMDILRVLKTTILAMMHQPTFLVTCMRGLLFLSGVSILTFWEEEEEARPTKDALVFYISRGNGKVKGVNRKPAIIVPDIHTHTHTHTHMQPIGIKHAPSYFYLRVGSRRGTTKHAKVETLSCLPFPAEFFKFYIALIL